MREQPFCYGATIFGQAVHAVVSTKMSDADIIAELRKNDFPHTTVRDITASLEDVFFTLTEEAAQARAANA